ncbi:denD, partial [Symbiodinium sp. CCMP2456]
RRARDCREWNDQELRRRNVLTGEATKEAPPSMGPSTPGPKRFERLRRLNLPIAAFCAAVTGMVPLGLMALLLFSDVAEGPPAVSVPTASQTLDSSFAGAAQLAELRLSMETLRQEMRRQDPAVASRLSMLEEAIAGDAGAASSSVASAAADAARKSSAEARAAAERAAALAAAVGERSGTSDPTADAIAGLGVDWAAWSAGADIDRSQSSGGLGRSLLGRLGRVLATLVPVTRTFLGAASHSPEVVLTWETGPPSRCFALDLPRGSLAIRFSRDIRPSHVVTVVCSFVAMLRAALLVLGCFGGYAVRPAEAVRATNNMTEDSQGMEERVRKLLCNYGFAYNLPNLPEGITLDPLPHPCCEQSKCAAINKSPNCTVQCHVAFRPPPEGVGVDMFLPRECAEPTTAIKPYVKPNRRKPFEVYFGEPNEKVLAFQGKRLDIGDKDLVVSRQELAATCVAESKFGIQVSRSKLALRMAREDWSLLKADGLLDSHGKKLEVKKIILVDTMAPSSRIGVNADEKVQLESTDITYPTQCCALVGKVPTAHALSLFHLAGVMSGAAEKDFDLGLRVNLDGTRHLLDACRARTQGGAAPAKFIFTSSLAVFGETYGEQGRAIGDTDKIVPKNTYGMTKAVCELLVNDYTRKSFIDGRTARLPTVIVRPGRPNAATTSCFSGVVREPLHGEDAVLPVARTLPHSVTSTRALISNLVILHDADWPQTLTDRSANLPSRPCTLQQLIDALYEVVPEDEHTKLGKIVDKEDTFLSRVVGSMGSNLSYERAR